MKNFKNYPQQYERFYDDAVDRFRFKFKHEEVSTWGNNPAGLSDYTKLLKDVTADMEAKVFDSTVKLYWLFSKFCYFGHRKVMFAGSGMCVDRAFAYFMRKYAGIEPRTFFGKYSASLDIADYLYDFFPELDDSDPFVTTFTYPFKYMNFGCLALVRRMDERMDLLNHGEQHKMQYGDFIDYVVNYVSCYNEEHGKKYMFSTIMNNCRAPFNITKYEERKFKARNNRHGEPK